MKIIEKKSKKIKEGFKFVKKYKFSPDALLKKGIKINKDGKKRNIIDLLSFSNITTPKLKKILPQLNEQALEYSKFCRYKITENKIKNLIMLILKL